MEADMTDITRWAMIKEIKDIGEHYGFEPQARQTMEECAELIQALNKYLRASGNGHMTTIGLCSAYENVTEEIADVLSSIIQIMHLLGIPPEEVEEVMKLKVERTKRHLVPRKEG